MHPGETTTDRAKVGRPLSWEEACGRIGKVILYEIHTQSMTYWMAVMPLRRLEGTQKYYSNGAISEISDRLICSVNRLDTEFGSGKGNHRLYIDEHYEPKFYEEEESV